MRHVAEGELHAYLDGGLELHPSGEAERIRAHLEACEACRARLEEARTLRDRASSVLAAAGPGTVELPPFEELRRRAAAGEAAGGGQGSRSGLSRAGVLRIAATAVVALGVGWMAGRVGGGPGAAFTDGVARSEAVGRQADAAGSQATSEGERQATSDAAAGPEAPGLRAEAAPDAAPDAAPAGEQAMDETWERVAERRRRSADDPGIARPATPLVEAESERLQEPDPAEERVAAAPDDTPPPATAAEEGAAAAPTTGEAQAQAQAQAQAKAGAPAGLDSTVGREIAFDQMVVTGVDSTADNAVQPSELRITPERAGEPEAAMRRAREAEEVDGRRMAVPGLEVVSVEWTEVAPDVEGLRVVQRLVNGETLELRFGGLEGGVPLPHYLVRESLPERIRQVAVAFEEGWLVARAPLEEEQLRALVALIR